MHDADVWTAAVVSIVAAVSTHHVCGSCTQRVIQPAPLTSEGAGAIDGHVHLEYHQLIVCVSGNFVAAIDGRSWVASPFIAVWIPAGTMHSVHTARTSTLRSAYICARHSPPVPTRPTLFRSTDLLVGLLDHLARTEPGSGSEREALAVLMASVETMTTSIEIQLPRDERALAVAIALLADPSDSRALPDWGRTVAASVRTLSRLFVNETGMTFVEWRRTVRLHSSVAHLTAGETVAVAAHRVGYESASAYIEAFRRWTGTTPQAFARDRREA